MKYIIHLAILLAVSLWIGGCDREPPIQPSGKMIKVGILGPFSGSNLVRGREGLKGMETAMILAPYLDNGSGIELLWENDEDDPALTLVLLDKLVKQDNVSAIITFSSSGPVLAMASVADTYGIPILAALATHPGITGHNDFISQICFDDTFQGAVAALFVRDELLLDKVAVFSNPNSNHSSFLAAEFERVYKSIGGRVTDSIFLSEQTKDYADILKGVRAKNPELLYVPVKAIDVIQVSKAANNLGWKPIAMTSDGVVTNVLTQYTEELDQLEGIMATDFFHSAMPLTPFGNKLQSAFQERATSYSVLGAEGYAILFSAMNRCNDPEDSTCINREIRSTTDFEGVMGKITIDVNGRAQRPLVVNVIKKGRMKFLAKVY